MLQIYQATSGEFESASCDYIEDEIVKKNKGYLIYFGDADDVKGNGKYSWLTEIAANDRHRNYGQDEIGFMYNDNETCMKNRGVPKNTLILYLHSEATPFVLQEGDTKQTKLTKDKVHTWVN